MMDVHLVGGPLDGKYYVIPDFKTVLEFWHQVPLPVDAKYDEPFVERPIEKVWYEYRPGPNKWYFQGTKP